METILSIVETIWHVLKNIIEVGVLAAFIYLGLYFLKGTRAAPILLGIVLTSVVGWVLARWLDLTVIGVLLAKAQTLIAVAVLIIFQPELRRAFAEIGSNPHKFLKGEHNIVQAIDATINASFWLAERKIGGLIAMERDIGMRSYAESGVMIDAPVSSELLMTIFYPNTPLHDGGVIIRGGVIVAASCFFPLTQTPMSRALGTRHRAGVGVTEETDAVIIIISEERGTVSLATKGILLQDIDKTRMRRHLTNYLVKGKDRQQNRGQAS